ncbi:MAG: glycosyltransferase family 39 protein [Nannocystaceae bacterium]|nr:glycosyltransferase family 39 protein [Nannocystaceae bacterium]
MSDNAPSDGQGSWFDRARVAVVLLVAFAVVLTFRDYGATLDEGFHLSYGHHIIRFYGSGFSNLTALTYRIDYLYGGGFDATGMIFRAWTRAFLDSYEAIHLYGALIGVLGIAGTGRLARLVAGPRAGFLAVCMLATTSVYYGHMFNNPKDLPFAVGYVWGLYFLLRIYDAFPRLPRRLILQASVALGFAMSVRIGGLLLLCYLGLLSAIFVARYAWINRSAKETYKVGERVLLQVALVSAGAWAVMLVWWPWALFDPIRRPLAALTRMSQFIDHRRYMPFAGEQVYNLDPPWDYLLHYFAFKLPEYVVVVFCLTTFIALGALVSGSVRAVGFRQALRYFILGLSIVFPPVYAVYKGSPLYDGLRHFLFLVPPIIVVVAVAADSVLAACKQRWGAHGAAVGFALIGGLFADQAATVARYHPHQYVYFNRFIGGLEGAVGQYSTDYYAGTYRDAARQLAVELWQREPEVYLESVYRVGGCIGMFRAMRNLPSNFVYKTESDANYDFDISYTRGDCHLKKAAHPEFSRVSRDGGLLTLTRDLRRQIFDAERVKSFRKLELAERQREKAKKGKGRGKKKRKKKRGTMPKPPADVPGGPQREPSKKLKE